MVAGTDIQTEKVIMTGSVFSRHIACSKMRVTPAQSKRVQKILFTIGFQWVGSIKEPINLKDRYLFLTYDFFTEKYMFLSTNDRELFHSKRQYERISYNRFVKLAREVKKIDEMFGNMEN